MNAMRRVAISVVVVFAAIPAAAAAERLQAGIAVADITPPIPFRLAGYFYERLSTGTKDPLHAKAVVFKQGKESAALVFCDLVGISLDVSSLARQKVSRVTGIPIDHIAVTATHTHTAPLFFGALHDYFHDREVVRRGKDPYDSAPYRAELINKIASAIVQANEFAKPVELKSGYAHEDRISFNRRFHMKDGSVQFNPPTQDPNIIEPAGPIDPQVGIVSLTRPGPKQPIAAIVSFAMHPDTIGGTLYSADFPKPLEDRLKLAFGKDVTVLFGNGTCGDINHRDVHSRQQRSTETLGEMLGDTVVNAIESRELQSGERPSLAVRSIKVKAPLQTFSEAEIAKARNDMARIGTRNLPFMEAVESNKIMDVELLKKKGGDFQLEVQAFRLDKDTAIVTLPSEIFVELGLKIKAASPFKTTLVVELADDSLEYIPTKKAFAEGSYEITDSYVQPGTGEKLVAAAVALIKELK
jgi:neutral ceramidase